jgi:hypothetical protein
MLTWIAQVNGMEFYFNDFNSLQNFLSDSTKDGIEPTYYEEWIS